MKAPHRSFTRQTQHHCFVPSFIIPHSYKFCLSRRNSVFIFKLSWQTNRIEKAFFDNEYFPPSHASLNTHNLSLSLSCLHLAINITELINTKHRTYIMTSCYGRFTGGYAVSYRLPQSRKPSRAAVISFHLRNLTTNQRPELFLRSSKRNNLYIVATATAAASAAGERSGGHEGAGACSYSVGDLVDLTTSSQRAVVNDERSYGRRVEVLVAAATAVALSVGNRVLYKLALVPLKHYPFFLAQIATFGYSLIFSLLLYYYFVFSRCLPFQYCPAHFYYLYCLY